MFENRAMKRIFGPKRECGRLQDEELNDLYSSNIIRVIKSRIMRCAGHLVRMGERGVHTELWWGNLRGRTWNTKA